MILSDDLPRTTNVIKLNNTHFANQISNKKIYSTKYDLEGIQRIKIIGSNMAVWLNSSHATLPTQTWDTAPAGRTYWSAGMNTYLDEIDVNSIYSQGVKYIYVLGTLYVSTTNGIASGILKQQMPIIFYTYNSGTQTYALVRSNSAEPIDNNPLIRIIKKIGEDESIGDLSTEARYNCWLCESVIDVEYAVSQNYSKGIIHYINESVPNSSHPGSPTINSEYPNTAIDHPIVYFIYEQ